MKKKRTGCIYSEFTNSGRSSVRYVRGCKPVYCFRWVGEICIGGKRHRFRSTIRENVRFWLDHMIAWGELFDKDKTLGKKIDKPKNGKGHSPNCRTGKTIRGVMKSKHDNRNSLYPGTAYEERRALLREYLGEAEAARIEAEEERKPLSRGIRTARQEIAEAQEKGRNRATKEARKKTAGGKRIVWTERIVCLGDGGGPRRRELVYEEVVRRHEAVVAANAAKEKRPATVACMKVTWPDGRSIVFRSIADARAALCIDTRRECLLHNKRLRGFTVEYGKEVRR